MESARSSGKAGTRLPDARIERTSILLLRHAHTDAVGRYLAGRAPGVPLSPQGRAQAQLLRDALDGTSIDAIFSSPLERAVHTALPLAVGRGLEVLIDDDLLEADFGDWTGRTFAELERLPEWRRYNRERSTAQVPRGEAPAALTRRIVTAVERIAALHPGGRIVAVTHAETIRAAVVHYRGLSLDRFVEIEIEPASMTTVLVGRGTAHVESVNVVPHLHTHKARLVRPLQGK
jgi:probable phosphoglycerate mutase